jgi:hypothetical protein
MSAEDPSDGNGPPPDNDRPLMPAMSTAVNNQPQQNITPQEEEQGRDGYRFTDRNNLRPNEADKTNRDVESRETGPDASRVEKFVKGLWKNITTKLFGESETPETKPETKPETEKVQNGWYAKITDVKTGETTPVYLKDSAKMKSMIKWWGTDGKWVTIDTIYPNMEEKKK